MQRKNVFRIALYLPASLATLTLLLSIGIVLLLNSPAGHKRIVSALNDFLEEKGLTLTVEKANIAFPYSLTVTNLSLADEKGPWLNLGSATIKINPWRLFSGEIDIETFEVKTFALERLPTMLEEEPSENKFTLPSIPSIASPWQLRRLKIRTLDVEDAFIGPEAIGVPITFSLSGATSAEGWQGQTVITSPKFSSISGSILLITEKSPLKDLQAPWKLEAQLTSAGNAPFFPGVLSQPLTVSLSLYPKQDYLFLDELSAQSNPWELNVNDLYFSPNGVHGIINLKGKKTSRLPFDSLALNAQLSGSIDELVCDLDATLEIARRTVQTILSSKLNGQTDQAELSASGSVVLTDTDAPGAPISTAIRIDALLTPELLSIKDFSGKNPFVDLSFSGQITPIGSLTANLAATTPNLKTVAGLFSLNEPTSGQASLNLEIRRKTVKDPINAASLILLQNMAWNGQAMQAFIGPDVRLSADIRFLEKPVLDLQLNNISLESKSINGSGTVSLNQDQIFTDLAFNISGLEQTNLPFTCEATISLQLQGSLDAPDVELAAVSPKVTFYSLEFENPTLLIKTTDIRLSKSQGTARLSTPKNSPYTADLSTNWSYSPNEIALQDISGVFLDAVLKGNLRLERPENLVQGVLSCSIQKWKELGRTLNKPIAGKASITTTFTPKNNQSLSSKVDLQDFSIGNDFSLKSLNGDVSIRELWLVPKIAANASAGKGAFSPLKWNEANLKITGANELFALDVNLLGDTFANVSLDLDTKEGDVYLKDLRFGIASKNQEIALGKPTHIAFSQQRFIVQNLELTLKPSGSITANVLISPQKLDVQTFIDAVSLSILDLISPIPLQGSITSSINISGTPERPTGELKLSGENVQIPNANAQAPFAFNIDGTFANTPEAALNFNAALTQDGKKLPATLTASFPIDFTEKNLPTLSKTAPFIAELRWNGDIESLWQFVPIADTTLAGQASLSASLTGSLENPRYQAQVATTNVTYVNLSQGIYLESIDSNINIDSNSTSKVKLTISRDQQTQVDFSGTVGPKNNDFPIAAQGTFTKFNPLQRKDLQFTLSGTTQISGTIQNALISGELTVNQGELKILNIPGKDIPTLNVVDPNEKNKVRQAASNYLPDLNISIHIPNQFFVRGLNLDSEWSGTILLKKNLSQPQITGKIVSLKGTFTLLGKDFLLTDSSIVFTGATPPIPALNIALTYKSPVITATASITGLATKPNFRLSSSPPLPQDEIVSQVLFGKNSQNLSKGQVLQLAVELSQLTGFNSGESNIFDKTKQITGADVVRISSAPKTNTLTNQTEDVPVLEIGKRLTDFIYLSFEQSLDSENSGARIEIELLPNLTLEGRTGLQRNEIGLNWKKDY